MNPRLALLLTRLYPRAWRERYGEEFSNLLQAGSGGFRSTVNVLSSAVREHIYPTRRESLSDLNSRFQSLCARAPWAVFALGPLVLLIVGYFIAGLILWGGWHIFLPFADTPFGSRMRPFFSFANFYFQAGKIYYGTFPFFVGWAITIVAARQRTRLFWPVLATALTAFFSSSLQVQAGRSLLHTVGHIRMSFSPLESQAHDAFIRFAMFFAITTFPYVLWRIFKARTFPA